MSTEPSLAVQIAWCEDGQWGDAQMQAAVVASLNRLRALPREQAVTRLRVYRPPDERYELCKKCGGKGEVVITGKDRYWACCAECAGTGGDKLKPEFAAIAALSPQAALSTDTSADTSRERGEGPHQKWSGRTCPLTNRPYFMHLEHPSLGLVPTYGGPFDSYTTPTLDDGDLQEELRMERYDHDRGEWIEGGEPSGLMLVPEAVVAAFSPNSAPAAAPVEMERDAWVPWKPGDVLPQDGKYWVTERVWGGRSNDVREYTSTSVKLTHINGVPWGGWDVRAYWSKPMPAPYQAIAAAGEGA